MKRNLFIALLAALLLAACSKKKPAPAATSPLLREISAATLAAPVASHAVYPFSVIPGGVLSQGELRQAIQQDPVVASHYRDLNPDRLESVRLQRDKMAYVSYRIKDRVYWTSHKIRLAKGELVFMGNLMGVRGRCGNQVSETPQTPVVPDKTDEPSGETLSTPILAPEATVTSRTAPPSQFPLELETKTQPGPREKPSIPGNTGVIPGGGLIAGGYGTVPYGVVGGGGGSPVGPAGPTGTKTNTVPGSPVIPPIEIGPTPPPYPVWGGYGGYSWSYPVPSAPAPQPTPIIVPPFTLTLSGPPTTPTFPATPTVPTTPTIPTSPTTPTTLTTPTTPITPTTPTTPEIPVTPPRTPDTPEPAAWLLMATGLAGAVLFRHKSRRLT